MVGLGVRVSRHAHGLEIAFRYRCLIRGQAARSRRRGPAGCEKQEIADNGRGEEGMKLKASQSRSVKLLTVIHKQPQDYFAARFASPR